MKRATDSPPFAFAACGLLSGVTAPESTLLKRPVDSEDELHWCGNISAPRDADAE